MNIKKSTEILISPDVHTFVTIFELRNRIVTVTNIIIYFHEKNKDDNYLAKAMIRYGKYWEE